MNATSALAREIAAALAPLLKEQVVPKRLFTTVEAAKYLGTSPSSVRQLVDNGDLRAVRFDSSLRFDMKDLALLVETRKD